MATNMKQHTCEGLEQALKEITNLPKYAPYNVPIFQDRWISGKTTGYLGTEKQVEKALSGTLHIHYTKINYCPFCGFKYKEESK